MASLKHLRVDEYPYFVTTRTVNGKRRFSDLKNAETLRQAVYFGRENNWYLLLSFVIMPDHLHLVIVPREKNISQIMKSIKGFTGRVTNFAGGTTGALWQEGFYDYVIDDLEKLTMKVRYIEENPVRKGLALKAEDYPFSSANHHNKTDLVSYLSK